MDPLQKVHIFLILGSPEVDMVLQIWPLNIEKTITCLSLLAMLFLTQARTLSAFFALKAHCWLMFNLFSTRTPKSHSAELLFSHLAPSRTQHCPFLNTMIFLSVQLARQSRSTWMAAQPLGIQYWVVTPQHFCGVCKFVEVDLCPITRLLTKRLNSTGPSISPWGTHQLLTHLQLNFLL